MFKSSLLESRPDYVGYKTKKESNNLKIIQFFCLFDIFVMFSSG